MSHVLINLFIVFIFSLIVQKFGLISTERSSIIFPNSDQDLNNLIERKILLTTNLTNEDQIFAALGIKRNPIEPRRRNNNNPEQVQCYPETRTVPVYPQGSQAGEMLIPGCIRVARCAGCCDIGGIKTCTPTKISYRKITRTPISIVVKRSTNAWFRKAAPQKVQVEVHEECKCMCKIKEENCDSEIHVYDSLLCQCNCKNISEQKACAYMGPLKVWDINKCECKCRKVKHCPSETKFSHDSCSCEEEASSWQQLMNNQIN